MQLSKSGVVSAGVSAASRQASGRWLISIIRLSLTLLSLTIVIVLSRRQQTVERAGFTGGGSCSGFCQNARMSLHCCSLKARSARMCTGHWRWHHQKCAHRERDSPVTLLQCNFILFTLTFVAISNRSTEKCPSAAA